MLPAKTIAYCIRIRGKVQGVAFRAYTQNKANELNIKGFVRNEPDGSVYIEAIGTRPNMQAFIEWCHHGSPLSIVEKVDIQPIEHLSQLSDYQGFFIKS